MRFNSAKNQVIKAIDADKLIKILIFDLIFFEITIIVRKTIKPNKYKDKLIVCNTSTQFIKYEKVKIKQLKITKIYEIVMILFVI